MKIFMIGDIVGVAGRKILSDYLKSYKQQEGIDFCLANAENAAAGMGLTKNVAQEIFESGVDVMTLGNHSFTQKGFIKDIDKFKNICRPANGPKNWPGKAYVFFQHELGAIIVINLMGQVFMPPLADPFQMIGPFIAELKETYQSKLVIVDFHAEATAEKQAMAWHLCDKISVLGGTHTHVQTADERILEGRMAYITDLGMTGPSTGVIGMSKEVALRRFVDKLPARYELMSGPSMIQGVVIHVDVASGRAQNIKRVCLHEDVLKTIYREEAEE